MQIKTGEKDAPHSPPPIYRNISGENKNFFIIKTTVTAPTGRVPVAVSAVAVIQHCKKEEEHS